MPRHKRESTIDLAAYAPDNSKAEAYYGLPQEVRFCQNCVISNQRPSSSVEFKHQKSEKKATIHFDEHGVCASAASSCASGAQQSSHVLAAMGVEPALGRGSLRLSLAPSTTEADVDRALAAVPAAVAQLRAGGRS